MITELQLKFKSDTGTSATTDELFDEDENPVEVPTSDYLEWLEDLATKQIKSVETTKKAESIISKMENIKLSFERLKDAANSLDPEDTKGYDVDEIIELCNHLESEIYD